MTDRPTLTLPPEPEGIIITCEAPGHPVEVTMWSGHSLRKQRIPAHRAVQYAREMLAAALHSGITERKEE